MKLTLEGDFGGLMFSGNGSSRFLSIPTDVAIQFFRKIALKYPELALNTLGIFSIGSIGRNREGKFASMGTPKHLLQARQKGCTWKSKGKISTDLTNITMCPIEYMGEQCPDAFWGDCFESIFGVGDKVHDLFGTAEGQAIMKEMLRQIYIGLGNSFFELAWWGQHPIIDIADADNSYTESRQQWLDYIDQQDACGGWMTMIDKYKNEDNLDQFSVPIYESDTDGKLYTGDAFDLLDRVLSGAVGTMDDILTIGEESDLDPILLCSEGIFDRIAEQIQLKFGQLPQSMEYFINSETVIGGKKIMRNTLRYKGYVIHKVSAWKKFDQITGTITHRMILTAPKVFGMIHDVPDLAQFRGMGLKVTQHLEDPYKGMTYMSTTFKMGTAILDKELIVNASLTLFPNAA